MSAYVLEINGIIGRDGIEILAIDVAMLGEFGVVPSGAGDPLAFGSFGGALADHRDDVGDGMDFGIGHVELIAKDSFGSLHHVCMYIDQAGEDGVALEIDELGARAGAVVDFGVGADG